MSDNEKDTIKRAVKEAMAEAGWNPELAASVVSMAKDYQFMVKGGQIIGKIVIAISVIVGISVGIIESIKALKGQ